MSGHMPTVSWSKSDRGNRKRRKYRRWETGYDDWVAGLDRIGTIGVYDEASQKSWMRSLAVQSIQSLEAAVTGNKILSEAPTKMQMKS